MPPHQNSLHLPLHPGTTLHLRHIHPDAPGPPVLLLHGAIENARVFYTPAGRGLAPFLAAHGFHAYAADFRGRGQSRPPIRRGHAYGQTETIVQEIPALFDFVHRHAGQPVRHVVSHSWGGVMLVAALARRPALARSLRSLTFFGTKRSVRAWNLQRLLLISLFWQRAAVLLAHVYGYLPAARFGLGSDAETVRSHAQSRAWVRPGPWVDPHDGFSYGRVVRQMDLPPAWFLAAARDPCLGHPDDVRRFMAECHPARARYTLLGRHTGYRHDYDHVSMLTHPDAPRDHFPQVARWLRRPGHPPHAPPAG